VVELRVRSFCDAAAGAGVSDSIGRATASDRAHCSRVGDESGAPRPAPLRSSVRAQPLLHIRGAAGDCGVSGCGP